MADLTPADREVIRTAAQLIEDTAEAIKACSTVGDRWDSPEDQRAYERETQIAAHLRVIAGAA